MKKLSIIFFICISFLSADVIQRVSDIKIDGKATMLIFDSVTCVYCERLQKDLQEDKELNALTKKMNVYGISLDKNDKYTFMGKETNTAQLRSMFNARGTPTIIIFNKEEKAIWQIPGYAVPKHMKSYVKFVLGLDKGKYKVEQWEKYLKDEGII